LWQQASASDAAQHCREFTTLLADSSFLQNSARADETADFETKKLEILNFYLKGADLAHFLVVTAESCHAAWKSQGTNDATRAAAGQSRAKH
jgi:hypothetical protein